MKHCACAFRLLVLFQVLGVIGIWFRSEAASPSLAVTLVDPQSAQLSWTNLPSGFRLEEADALSPTNAWNVYSQGPTLQNNQFFVTVVVAPSANRFFRLRQSSTDGLPADPAAVASALDPTVVTDFSAATAFLYAAGNPIQTGVTNGAIEARRAAVLRGKVAGRDGLPLAGVTISALGHPECGRTLTRADGVFDLAINGGGQITVHYEKKGFLSAQRAILAPSRDYAWLPEVLLIPLDSVVTAVDLSGAGMQVARGSMATDANGARRATMLLPNGTTASLIMPDGTAQPLNSLHIRATEFTVGANGPAAMPGPLPPSSGYTYCAELSVDEAVAAGASEVRFNQALPMYVENFLRFPVGTAVPAGYYSREKGQWIASANGRVIKVLSVTTGMADLDTDGDAAADSATKLAALGVTSEERAHLAQLYTAGQTLWRVPVTHFTPWDLNWPYALPPDAILPPEINPENPVVDRPNKECGSVIDCENQSLGESVPIVGSSWRLQYQSQRTPGRKSSYTINIPVSGAAPVPGTLAQMRAEVSIAGRTYQAAFAAAPNITYSVTWDGKDSYGRMPQGAQVALIQVHYDYVPQYYSVRGDAESSFAEAAAAGASIFIPRDGSFITVSKSGTQRLGVWDARALGLGGWSLDIHHAYDVASRTLFLGDGRQRTAEALAPIITLVAGKTFGFSGDGGPAVAAKLGNPTSSVVAPDGSLLIADFANNRVRRVGLDGIISTIAGNAVQGFGGDGGPATGGSLYGPRTVAAGPDGSLYIADRYNHRIRRIRPDGIMTTVAGIGAIGFDGDGGDGTPALGAQVFCDSVAIGPDGSIYIADLVNNRVRRVGPNGIITTVAGSEYGLSGDGGPAKKAKLGNPSSVVVGADGGLFVADYLNNRVRRIAPDGIITTVAGNGAPGFGGDGGPATAAKLYGPQDVALGRDGSLFIADSRNFRIRRVGPDGIISTVAGYGLTGVSGDGGPATAAQLAPTGVAVGSDGSLFITDFDHSRVRRVASPLTGYSVSEILLPSEDGREVYVFSALGRHLKTVDSLTGAVRYQFAYNTSGYLISITDNSGNVATIERSNLIPTAIVAPGGQRTALLLNPDGWLQSATNPATEAHSLTYSADGLLQSFTDPVGNIHKFTYDAVGRLIKDEEPGGGSTSLARTEQSNGYTVTTTSALGRIRSYQATQLPTGAILRTVTQPTGASTTTLIDTDGTERTTNPDGSSTTVQYGPDPRWGMLAPIASSVILKTPGGLTRTITTSRTATLSDPLDLLSLSTLTDVVMDNAALSTSVYDAKSRLLTITTAVGRTASYSRDVEGRLTQEQIAGFAPLAYSYDAHGFLSSILQGTGTTARTNRFRYDPAGDLISITDPLEHSFTFTYDSAGRVITENLPDARMTALAYDANGNISKLTPPGKPVHTFAYSAVDQKTLYSPPTIGPGTNSTRYIYNPDRELTAVKQADQETLQYDYSPSNCNCGRLSSIIQARGSNTYDYDPLTGSLTGIKAPGGIDLAFDYDGNLVITETRSGTLAGHIDNTYDSSFRLSTQGVNGGAPIIFAYDLDNFLTGAGELTVTRNDGNGSIETTALGDVLNSWTYNDFGEISDSRSTFNAADLFAVKFTRDRSGRIVQKTETVGGVSDQFVYNYDLGGRLVGVLKNGATAATYAYDSNDNRLSSTADAGTTNGTYDNQDRLIQYGVTSYTYTDSGNLKARNAGGQITSYTYDTLGNLITVALPNGTQIEYLIDGLNRRIGKKVNGTVVQGFLYDGQLRRIAELDGAGHVVSRFVYGTRNSVPDYMIKAGVSYQIVSDYLGSPRLMVDSTTGTIAQRMDYDEFGRVVSDTNPGFQPFGFGGGLYDRDTKLVRFGARDYDADTGRWTAKDPIAFDSEDTNLYGYVLADPVNFKDSNGLAGVSVGGALWVKSKDTAVIKDATYTGERLRFLQPGDEVKWLGPDRSSGLHRVEVKLANGKVCKGYVLPSNLTPTAPTSQPDHGDGKPIDAHSLASSGAATRG
jgi:RHS repeat-associated protein